MKDTKGKYVHKIPYGNEKRGYMTLKGEIKPIDHVSISFALQGKSRIFTEVFYIVDTIGSNFDFLLCRNFLFSNGIFRYSKDALIDKEEMSAQVSYLVAETPEGRQYSSISCVA